MSVALAAQRATGATKAEALEDGTFKWMADKILDGDNAEGGFMLNEGDSYKKWRAANPKANTSTNKLDDIKVNGKAMKNCETKLNNHAFN